MTTEELNELVQIVSKNTSAEAALYDALKRIAALEAELAVYRQDLKDAATDLPVALPEPGTEMAKMLMANRLIIADRDRLTRELAEARENPRDEYHTMKELYEYRMLYHMHACQAWIAAGFPVMKSWRHSDGELCFGGGWFIVVAQLPTGQVSNHYKEEHWGQFFVPIVELPPEYDGHTPADAAKRLHCVKSLSDLHAQLTTAQAECERLSSELSACTDSPGGCGYWRDAARMRTEENAALTLANTRMREALGKIERWFKEFPLSNYFYEDGTEMSYGAAFGSNGERDYMREVARQALAAMDSPTLCCALCCCGTGTVEAVVNGEKVLICANCSGMAADAPMPAPVIAKGIAPNTAALEGTDKFADAPESAGKEEGCYFG